MKWTEQKELVAGLARLRYFAERTNWTPEGTDTPVPPQVQMLMQEYARDLYERCQFNFGWHSAKQGDELNEQDSTAVLNAKIAHLVKTIEGFGQQHPPRGRGQPEKDDLDEVDLFIWKQFKSDPEKRTLEEFVGVALATKQFPEARRNAQPASHVRRLRAVGSEYERREKKRLEDEAFDPETASVEEYVEKRHAGWNPSFGGKGEKNSG